MEHEDHEEYEDHHHDDDKDELADPNDNEESLNEVISGEPRNINTAQRVEQFT